MPFEPFDPQSPAVIAFREKILSRRKLFLFYLWRLPTLAWWGLRVEHLGKDRCTVSLRQSFRTKNPFGSIYFSALLGAAELATGILCLQAMAGRARVSMLVTGMSAEFVKKAKGKIHFTCEEGEEIIRTIDEAIQQDEPKTIEVRSTGYNTNREIVAFCKIQWSFKMKSTH